MPIGDSILALPQHLRGRLAAAVDGGTLDASSPITMMRTTLGVREGAEGVQADLAALERMGIAGPVAAAWIRALDRATAKSLNPDLVWSGPKVPGVPARDTAKVFDELVRTARRSLIVCTYAYFDGPQVFAQLAERLDEAPSLRLTLLLNIQRGRGDTSASDQLVRRFTEQFWHRDWPGSARPSVYYDPRSLDAQGPGGVLHAKALVADDQVLFITSANLTDAAQNRNIELGALIRDRTLAMGAASHFQGLIDGGLLSPLPGS